MTHPVVNYFAVIDNMRAEIENLKGERNEFLNLVACICGDGGHYHEEHGTKDTVKFCIDRVTKLRENLDSTSFELNYLLDDMPGSKD